MQTLGLASEGKPTDGMLKRLFWPTIENQFDLDAVSVQGFWVCTVCAVLSMILLISTGNALIGIVIGVTFFLGGMGVRERSIAAAVLVFSCYALDKVLSIESLIVTGVHTGGSPVIGIVTFTLLLANVRGTMLARKWRMEAARGGYVPDPDAMPERMTSTFGDKLANVMPAKFWPGAKFVFFPLAALLLGFTLVLIAATPFVKKQVRQAQQAQQQQDRGVYEVTPSGR